MDIRKKARQLYRTYRRQTVLQTCVKAMAAVVVFCTTYALILPAITMETETLCGLTEHTHSESCFQTLSPPECTLPESEGHTHDDTCITQTSTLTCTLEEVQSHSHTDACYTRTAVCGTEEQAAHTHSDACLGTVSTLLCTDTTPEHAHVGTCYSYETGLVCGQEETEGHSHTDDCFQTVLSCTLAETEGHVHASSCYTLAQSLSCGLEESQGHSHASDPADPITEIVCGLTEHSHSESCYPQTEPETDSTEDTATGETTEATVSETTQAPTEETTETTESTEVTEPEPPVYSHEDDTGMRIQVSLEEGATVPADAALTVTPITEENGQYAALAELLTQSLTGTVEQLTLLDISFYDAAGDYLKVSDTARVSLSFDGALFTAGEVKVFHFVDGTPVELGAVSLNHIAAAAEDGTEHIQTQLSFETDGFSVFAVVEVVGNSQQVTGIDTTALAGDYYILNYDSTRAMKAAVTTANTYSYSAIEEVAVTDTSDLNGNSLWTLEWVSDSNYKIYSTDTSNTKQYLAAVDVKENTSGWDLGALTLTSDATAASVFTAEAVGTKIKFYTSNGTKTRYITDLYNEDLGDDYFGFTAHTATDGNQLTLYKKAVATDTTVPVTGLDGKSFAIFNEATGTAMSSTSDTEDKSSAAALDALPASLTQIDGADCFTSEENVPLWTFTAVENKSGVYYISTTVGTETKYLNLTTATSGALTLSTTAQELTVTQANDGKVFIGNGTTRLNSSGSDGEGDFWCYNDSGANCMMTLCKQTPVDLFFTITYNDTYTIKFKLVDSRGTPLYAMRTDYTLSTDSDILEFSDIAPNISGYTYASAYFGDNKITIAGIGPSGNQFRLYEPAYFDTPGTQYYSRNENLTVTLVYNNSLLNYNLNRPTEHWFGNDAGWDVTNPTIGTTGSQTSASQDILADTTGQTIYSVSGRNLLNKFISFNTHQRTDVSNYFNDCNQALYTAGTLNEDNYLPPGAEWVFLGWKAAIGGTDYLFPEGAAVSKDADGNFLIEDSTGTIQAIPAGTTLTGQWKQVSNVVMFFVNHGDTMLEHEDNQFVTNTSSSYFTQIVAVGHLYNPVQILPTGVDENGTTRRLIKKSTHDLIERQLMPYYDPADTGTQVVVDAIKVNTGSTRGYQAVSNYNETLLEKAVSTYIQNDTDKTILLDNAELDKAQITTDNYKLYWYNQLLISDEYNPYHINGVLVAKTQPMEIYKTFSGLSRADAQTAINAMTFPLHLVHTTGGTDVKDAYTTLNASSSQTGVYSSDGWQSTSSNIFKWTLESVQGQRYTFEEENYALTGYDCSSLVSVHYSDADKTVVYKYNTDATYTDTTVDGVEYAIQDLFAANPLIGGNVESIIFANFYTQTGTGMFSISKVADAEGKIRLSGAEFQLKQGDTVIATAATNENGAAHFSNLPEGNYTLTETMAPTGYQSISTTWPVAVAKDSTTGQVTVTVNGELVYNNLSGGIQKIYLIQNQPEDTTVTVNKYFTNISDAEVKTLTDYCIEVADSNGGLKNTLTLANATAITGAINGYTWTMDLTCGTSYTFTEKNYSHGNYLDTVVSAAVNGTAAAVTKSDSNTTASFSMTKSEAADTVTVTNDYTNTFDLRIKKVDATAGNAPMADVIFNIYGDFQFHVQPPSGIDATISYQDTNGASRTAYYIGTTTATDANGFTLFTDMHLSSGSNSFLYVISEANTPDGYVELDEPIVRKVTVDGGDANYVNGVYTLTVENYQEAKATVSVTAVTTWSVPEGMTKPPVTLNLYKKAADGTISRIGEVTLDGTGKSETTAGSITVSVDGWKVTWSALAYLDGDKRIEYYVSENLLPGFITTYDTAVSSMGDGAAAAIAEGNRHRFVTILNTAGFELPETGGSGVRWFAPMGLTLMLAAIALAACLRKPRRIRHPK